MNKLTHKFVEFIPDALEEGVIYVSFTFGTASHRCCCGCGREVVTPFSPSDWKLIFDGETISLTPSIGNWDFACRSHYWIRRNSVQWCEDWGKTEDNKPAGKTRKIKEKNHGKPTTSGSDKNNRKPRSSFWSRFWMD